jgi:uncharacterized protein (TIGR03083 family)
MNDPLWTAIDAQRTSTAELLGSLAPGEWDCPSLCAGWSVRDVAAHLTLQQLTLGQALHGALRHPGPLNRIIRETARERAGLPTDLLVRQIRETAGSRRHNVGLTPLETLIDVVVHGQDIAVPLRRDLAVPPGTALLTADRVWWCRSTRSGRLRSHVFAGLDHRGVRFVATDADWSAGHGAEVRGPLLWIVLLLTGRPAGLAGLDGAGAALLGQQLRVRAAKPAGGAG